MYLNETDIIVYNIQLYKYVCLFVHLIRI